ncbi:hypothetical protein [Xenorhabdus griffiniae]|uniref:hypothetical protein n=1 Tax=Xenorhabdus griffiniae TaxID=351672 RepID=UPI00235907ED|nr:hypothetical protein [Xenorhabdus griffiniae]MDC9603939.1 hypothetical protein [Xenorhabdus griffiniae]
MITLKLTPEIINNINRKFVLDLFVWQKRWKANQHHRNRFLHENSYVAALSGDVYVSEWAWSDNPIRLVQLALSLTMHDKWHRTFYSSRCSGDSGELAYKQFFTLNRIKGEPAFFDTVTLFDFAESRWSEERLRQHQSQQEFEELFLCRLPHPRW